MYQKERLERILDFLNRNGYATVKELTELLHYSTATVNRDLNALEQMKKIKRSYGGAEPVKACSGLWASAPMVMISPPSSW